MAATKTQHEQALAQVRHCELVAFLPQAVHAVVTPRTTAISCLHAFRWRAFRQNETPWSETSQCKATEIKELRVASAQAARNSSSAAVPGRVVKAQPLPPPPPLQHHAVQPRHAGSGPQSAGRQSSQQQQQQQRGDKRFEGRSSGSSSATAGVVQRHQTAVGAQTPAEASPLGGRWHGVNSHSQDLRGRQAGSYTGGQQSYKRRHEEDEGHAAGDKVPRRHDSQQGRSRDSGGEPPRGAYENNSSSKHWATALKPSATPRSSGLRSPLQQVLCQPLQHRNELVR